MKKDVLLALILGLSLGAGIAIITVRLPNYLTSKKAVKNNDIAKETQITSLPLTGIKLEISAPPDQSIMDSENIILKGTTLPETTVLIESAIESQALESDKNGSFSADLKLIEGGNPVFVTAFDENGNDETKSLNFYYTTEKI